jgi:hypothetical protein
MIAAQPQWQGPWSCPDPTPISQAIVTVDVSPRTLPGAPDQRRLADVLPKSKGRRARGPSGAVRVSIFGLKLNKEQGGGQRSDPPELFGQPPFRRPLESVGVGKESVKYAGLWIEYDQAIYRVLNRGDRQEIVSWRARGQER